MLPVLLDLLRVARCGPGRPRTRPDALLADKAYSSRAHRTLLRTQGITAVIPRTEARGLSCVGAGAGRSDAAAPTVRRPVQSRW